MKFITRHIQERQLFPQHFKHHHHKISSWKCGSIAKGVGVAPTQDFCWGNYFLNLLSMLNSYTIFHFKKRLTP